MLINRPMVYPNNAFVEQLLEYEKEIFGNVSEASTKLSEELRQPHDSLERNKQ